MVVDRGHVAPSALQWMAMLQAAAAGGIEDQVYRRLGLIRDKRLGTPAKKPNCHRRFAIVPNLEFCGVDRVLRHQPAGVDARRRLTDALLDSLEVGDLLAAEHDGSVSLRTLFSSMNRSNEPEAAPTAGIARAKATPVNNDMR